jgi:hypothetical protein
MTNTAPQPEQSSIERGGQGKRGLPNSRVEAAEDTGATQSGDPATPNAQGGGYSVHVCAAEASQSRSRACTGTALAFRRRRARGQAQRNGGKRRMLHRCVDHVGPLDLSMHCMPNRGAPAAGDRLVYARGASRVCIDRGFVPATTVLRRFRPHRQSLRLPEQGRMHRRPNEAMDLRGGMQRVPEQVRGQERRQIDVNACRRVAQ